MKHTPDGKPVHPSLEETKESLSYLIECKHELMVSSLHMADPERNSIDAEQWASIYEGDIEELETLKAALHWLNVEITNDQAEVRVIEADDDRVTPMCQQARAWLFGASGCSARARCEPPISSPTVADSMLPQSLWPSPPSEMPGSSTIVWCNAFTNGRAPASRHGSSHRETYFFFEEPASFAAAPGRQEWLPHKRYQRFARRAERQVFRCASQQR